jgi:predicted glycosyltransferase
LLSDTGVFEEKFNIMYPGGFSNPEMLAIANKHKIEKMHELAKENFAVEQFQNDDKIVEAIGKIVSKSSLVLVFEKVKFRYLLPALNENEKERLSKGLRDFLHVA